MSEINWDVVIGEPGWSDGLEPYPAFRRKPKKAPVPKKTAAVTKPVHRVTSEMPIGGKGGKSGFRPSSFTGREL